MRRFASALFRLRALSAGERADVARAQLALCGAQLLVWFRPEGQLIEPMGEDSVRAADPVQRLTASRLARSVSRASKYGLFRPSCLVRALALVRLLERGGVGEARMRIGVRERAGRFEAHAWVELGGEVLGDTPTHTRAFAALADVRPIEAQ
jgi:hypothetical protein